MTDQERRIQSCIDHINTAVDVDPWAKELVVEMGKEVLKYAKDINVPINDCISRQGAIEGLTGYIDDTGIFNQDKWFVHGIKTAITHLKSLPSVQPNIIHCKDCKHRPVTNDNYDDEEWDCGFNIEFPDYKCPCRCDDGWYNRLPDDNWFCGNAERRTE